MASETETAVNEATVESPPAPGAVSKPKTRQRMKRGQARVPKQNRMVLKGNSVRAEEFLLKLAETIFAEIVLPTCRALENPDGNAQSPISIDTAPHNWDTALGIATGSQHGKRDRGGVEVLSPFEGNTAEKWDIHGTGRMNVRRSVSTMKECVTMLMAAIIWATVSKEKGARASALQRHHFVPSRGEKGNQSKLRYTTFDAAASINSIGRAYAPFIKEFERKHGTFLDRVYPATVQRLSTTGGEPSKTRKPLYVIRCHGGASCKAGARQDQAEWDALGPRPQRKLLLCGIHARDYLRVEQVVGDAAIQPAEPLKLEDVNQHVADAKAKLEKDREAELKA